ncbi:hypothetical protein OEZ86_010535 [Tetradesmus obliquus]|nr:hypothetical protein OEZ86_010535 [Tetradesmus obliquus]
MQAGRCNSGCQPRNSDWARRCQWDRHGSVWGVCSPQQAARSLEFAKTLGGGSILGMSPCNIMPYLQGRTLWLIGDSHSKVLYRALGCFLIDFHGQKECEPSSDAAAVQQLRKLPAAPGQSKCLHLLDGGRVCIVHAALGTALVNNKEVASGGVMPLLRAKFAQPQDIFYVSYGSWHGKSPAYWAALRPAMEGLAADYRATKSRFPHVLFREQPAYHKADASKQFCTPAKGLMYQASTGQLQAQGTVDRQQQWILGGTTNQMANEVFPKAGIPVISAYNMSVPLHDAHVGKVLTPGNDIDCIHYCHPGVPEAWIWQLYQALRSGATGLKPTTRRDVSRMQQFKCVPSTSAAFDF